MQPWMGVLEVVVVGVIDGGGSGRMRDRGRGLLRPEALTVQ